MTANYDYNHREVNCTSYDDVDYIDHKQLFQDAEHIYYHDGSVARHRQWR